MSVTIPRFPVADVVNVKAYGAKGDGSTDDTTAFQDAIDDLESATNSENGGMLIVPKGVYQVGALTITGRIILFGGGATSRLELIDGADAYMFTCTKTVKAYGVFFDGQKANQSAGGVFDLQSGADFSNFLSCSIYDGYEYGLKIQGLNQVGVNDCKLFNHGTAAAFVKNSTAICFHGGTTIEDNEGIGIHGQGSSSQLGLHIHDCYFENNGNNNSGTDSYHVYLDALQDDQLGGTGNSLVTIERNYMNGNASSADQYGVYIAGAQVGGVRVNHNTFLDCDKGAFEFGTITTPGLNDLRWNQYAGGTPVPSSASGSFGFMFDDAVEMWLHSPEYDLSAGTTTDVLLSLAGTKNIMVREAVVHYTEATSADAGVALKLGITGASGQYLNITSAISQSANAISDESSNLTGWVSASHEYAGGTITDKALVSNCAGGKTGTGDAHISARVLIH